MSKFYKPNRHKPITFEKGGGDYLVDVTTYVPTDVRCAAIDKASKNNTAMRAQLLNFGDDSLYDVVTQVDSNGNELVPEDANINASNGRNNVVYGDRLDIADQVRERTQLVEDEAARIISDNLAAERQQIKAVAHAKAAKRKENNTPAKE